MSYLIQTLKQNNEEKKTTEINRLKKYEQNIELMNERKRIKKPKEFIGLLCSEI